MTSTPSDTLIAPEVLDRTGVAASVACAIHCLIAPVILVAAPALGGWWVHPATHLVIAALVLPVAGMALWRGYRAHARSWILVAGGVGMALVGVGVLLPFLESTPESVAAAGDVCRACCPTLETTATGETRLIVPAASIVTMLGGLALIAAHIGNLRCVCGPCRGAAGCPVE